MPVHAWLLCVFIGSLLPLVAVGEGMSDVESTVTDQPPQTRSKTTKPRPTANQAEKSPELEQYPEENWIDEQHRYLGTKADDLAIYLDRFFGSSDQVRESPDTTLRMNTRYQWDDDDGEKIDVRLRGKVHLPKIDKRLSLLLNYEDEDYDQIISSDDERTEGALQYNTFLKPQSRLDFTLSLSSDLNLSPGVRYRFTTNMGESWLFRYRGELAYSNPKRFFQQQRVELDYITGVTSLARWTLGVERGQRSEGTEWASLWSWRYGYSLDSAIGFVVGVTGETDPNDPDDLLTNPEWPPEPFSSGPLYTNYGLIIQFRNRIYKDWLFVEFEPGYVQRKDHHYDRRRGVYFGRFNVEIVFNRGREEEWFFVPDTNIDNIAFR